MYAVTTAWTPRRRARSDAPSFATVAEEHLDDVYAYLVYLTRDRDLAEDLAAETFAKACAGWRRYDPRRGSPKTWLCQLARTTALDHFRTEERRRKREIAYALHDEDAVAPSAFGEGLSPMLEAALARLSAAEREVIALRVVLELDAKSAARLLGISTTACSTRLHRALQKLETEVRDDVLA